LLLSCKIILSFLLHCVKKIFYIFSNILKPALTKERRVLFQFAAALFYNSRHFFYLNKKSNHPLNLSRMKYIFQLAGSGFTKVGTAKF